MALKTSWGGIELTGKNEIPLPNPERYLSMLVDGAARNVPEVDVATYKEFRSNLSRLSLQLPDRLPDADKLALIRVIIHEFENYRDGSERAARERLSAWRGLVEKLLLELLSTLGIPSTSPQVAPMAEKLVDLRTVEDVHDFKMLLQEFLHPTDPKVKAPKPSFFKEPDRSTENDNASGLLGGGAAVEHLQKIMDRGGKGFIAVFRLSCLEVISQRFGPEAVQDCLMAVSAFLTESLQNEDTIYHWSDSSLLAILENRVNEVILNAQLQRIAAANRETNVTIGGRNIMLRLPITFDLTPINRLRNADDLFKLAAMRTTNW
jgi:GGDEF domain-containing protein